MSIFKKIPRDDIVITPYTAHKKYTLLLQDYSASFNGLEPAYVYGYEGIHQHSYLKDSTVAKPKHITSHVIKGDEFNSGSEDTTTNNFIKRSVHDSLQHMYYRSVRDLSNTFCVEPTYNEFRELNSEVQVISIPQRMFGDKIHETNEFQKSIIITSGTIEIRDDGSGNLYDLAAGGFSEPLGVYRSMTGSLVFHVGFNEKYPYHQPHIGPHCPVFQTILEDKSRYATDTRGETLFFNTGSQSKHGTGLMLTGRTGANIYDPTRHSYFRAKRHQNLDFRKDENFAVSLWCNLPTSQSNTKGLFNYILTTGKGDHSGDTAVGGSWRSRFPFDICVFNETAGLKERTTLNFVNVDQHATGSILIKVDATHSAAHGNSPSESVFFQLTDTLGTTVKFHCTSSPIAHTQATYPTISFHGTATSSAITMASISSARINQGILLGYTASGNDFPLLISSSFVSYLPETYPAKIILSQSIPGTSGNSINTKLVGVAGTAGVNNTFHNDGFDNHNGGTGGWTNSSHYTSSYFILTTRGPHYGGPGMGQYPHAGYPSETESYERHVFYWHSASNVPPQLGTYTTHSTTAIDLARPSFLINPSVSGSHDAFSIASQSAVAIESHTSFSQINTSLGATWNDNASWRHYYGLHKSKGYEYSLYFDPLDHGNVPTAVSGGNSGLLVNTAAGGAVISSTTSSFTQTDGNRGIPGQILARRNDGTNLFQVSSSTIVTESWNHVLYQKTGSMLQLYVNNIMECEITASDEGLQLANKRGLAKMDDLYFGVATRMTWSGKYKRNDAGDIFINRRGHQQREYVREFMRPVSGAFDEIRIYDEALNSDQRQFLYNCPNGTPYIGNAFYEHGILTITHPSTSYAGIAKHCTMSFKNTYEIQEHEYTLNVKRGEYNFTMNPSIIEKTATGSKQSKISDYITETDWDPYISTVGLYNDAGQLLVIGKLSRPLRKEDGYDTTIVVRYDT